MVPAGRLVPCTVRNLQFPAIIRSIRSHVMEVDPVPGPATPQYLADINCGISSGCQIQFLIVHSYE